MNFLVLSILGLLKVAFTKMIEVRYPISNDFCGLDCVVKPSILEALDHSFNSDDNFEIKLLEVHYNLTSEIFDDFLNNHPGKSLFFQHSVEKNTKNLIISGDPLKNRK